MYYMNCVKLFLFKKFSCGFVWFCVVCSRVYECRFEGCNIFGFVDGGCDGEDDEFFDDEDEEMGGVDGV